jgi:DNA-binding GntR family transcriptional regulator
MEPPRVASHPYQAVAAAYIRKIKSGELSPGDKLPSVRQVAKDHDVSPMTAQKALSQLADDGYAQVVAGLGYFVVDPAESPSDQTATLQSVIQQLDGLQAVVEDLAQRLQRLEDADRQ